MIRRKRAKLPAFYSSAAAQPLIRSSGGSNRRGRGGRRSTGTMRIPEFDKRRGKKSAFASLRTRILPGIASRLATRSVAVILSIVIFVIACGFTANHVVNSKIKNVTLNFDGTTVGIETVNDDVASVLEQYNIDVGAFDVVEPSMYAKVTDGMTISVSRAINVTVVDVDSVKNVSLQSGSVADAVKFAGIILGPYDEVSPAEDTMLRDNMTIQISRVRYETVTEENELAYKVKYVETNSLYIGDSEVKTEGENGTSVTKYTQVYKNGQLIDQYLTREEVIEEPQDRVVMVGSMPTPTPTPKPTPKPTPEPTPRRTSNPEPSASAPQSTPRPTATRAPSPTDGGGGGNDGGNDGNYVTIGGERYHYSKMIICTATAYTHTGRRTYTGTWPKVGTVAVKPRYIPLGTRMYIPLYHEGISKAEDTGYGLSDNYWIDLFMETESECVQWGIRKIPVYILD